MSPLRPAQSIHASVAYNNDLSSITSIHSGQLPRRYGCFQPRISPQKVAQSHRIPELPLMLLDKISNMQYAAMIIASQKKDASQLREFLSFSEGLGISAHNSLPEGEDILLAWALSYAGRIAGKTVSAKLSAVKKEHEKRGLPWLGGEHLCRIL